MTDIADNFKRFPPQLLGPFDHAFQVTPDNSANLESCTRSLFVGSGGTLVVDMKGGEEDVVFVVQDGQQLDLRVLRVKTAGTANNIVGLY